MEYLSAKEYAIRLGVDVSYIVKVLKASGTLPLVQSVEKYGNTWRIAIESPFDKIEAKSLLKTFIKP